MSKTNGLRFNTQYKKNLLGKYTMTEFANRCGMAKTNVSNILNGKSNVSKPTAYMLTDVCNKINSKNYSIEFFFYKVEDNSKDEE
jgi:transcriptional regulator with XRE-family HTH domain